MGQKRYITLYHFCADFCLSSILKNGLTMGSTPIFENGSLRVEGGTQWLTKDGNPDRQSWNTQSTLPYSRTARRLTINIPYSHRKKIVPAHDFMAQYPAENAELVDGWTGGEHWFVYRGKIPPSWIVGHR